MGHVFVGLLRAVSAPEDVGGEIERGERRPKATLMFERVDRDCCGWEARL